MQTSPCKQRYAQPTQTPSITRSHNSSFLRASSVHAQTAHPEPPAAPDDNDGISYLPAKSHVPLCYCRKDISKDYFANAPLQMHFDYSCGEEQFPPVESCGLRCSFWRINWGYAKDIKSPKEINLQIHPTSPQLPYVSHSISNCP